MRRTLARGASKLAVLAALGLASIWAISFGIDRNERFHQFGDRIGVVVGRGMVWLANEPDYDLGDEARPFVLTPSRVVPRVVALDEWRIPGFAIQTGRQLGGTEVWSLDLIVPGLEAHYCPPPGADAVWSVGASPLIPAAAALAAASVLSRRRRAAPPSPVASPQS